MTDVKTTSVADLVRVYRKVRDAIATEESEHEKRLEVLKQQMEVLSAELLDFCNQQDLDSIRTPEGTVSRRVQTRYWTNDWEEMYNFVQKHEVPFVLEKRIHNGNMKQFLEENPDVLPRGLQVDRKYILHVRKPSNKGE